MKEPTKEEMRRCLDLRRRSKRGEYLPPSDLKFCSLMLKKYPDWYSGTESRVFNETAPFGANAGIDLTNKERV